MQTVLIVIHVLLAIALIGMVLVQRGPGAAAGAAFGSGASSTVFGSRGAGSFLTRTTAVLGTCFFLVSLIMAVMVSRGMFEQEGPDLGIMSGVAEQQAAQEQAGQTSAEPPAQAEPQESADTAVPPPPAQAEERAPEETTAVPEPPPGDGSRL